MRVVDNATVRRIDARCIAAGTDPLLLMEGAGAGAARAFLAHSGAETGTTVIFCGNGNNGGDGLVMARHLHLGGHRVRVACAGGALSPGCATNLERAVQCGVEVDPDPGSVLKRVAGRWVVDALLGTGFAPPLRSPLRELAAVIRESARPVVALDAPTGVDADTGAADAATPAARFTFVFGPPRRGLLAGVARNLCGEIFLVDPGFDPGIVAEESEASLPAVEWVDAGHAAGRWPQRPMDAYKYSVGSLLVVAGSRGMSGAAAFAARAAHRSGAGLVEILTPEPVAATLDLLTPESLTTALSATPEGSFAPHLADAILERAEARKAVVLGCGVGAHAGTAALMVELCRRNRRPAVVDADALNAFGRTGSTPAFGGPCVLTPHAAELGRLTGETVEQIQADRLGAARRYALAHGVVVLLKGSPTVVAAPDGALALIGTGGPELATAGSGDVLAGIIGALLAAGLAPLDAATTGAWVHGRAGARLRAQFGASGVVASDLPEEVARVGRALEDLR